MPKLKINQSHIRHILKFFGFSAAPMRSILAVLFLGVTIGVAYEEMVGIGTWHQFQTKTDKLNVCFTPPSGCGALIAQEITKAKNSIFIQAYGLTSNAIIYQIKAAKSRGVRVHILLDNGNLSDNQAVYLDLKHAGINVAFDKMPGIAHNKVMIIDQSKVITGSFNFTTAADNKNAENVLLIEDVQLAEQYLINWHKRYEANQSKAKLD